MIFDFGITNSEIQTYIHSWSGVGLGICVLGVGLRILSISPSVGKVVGFAWEHRAAE